MGTVSQAGVERHETVTTDCKKIALATDFSSTANKALEYAAAVAREYHGEIAIVHAIAPEPRLAVPMDPLPKEMDSAYSEAKLQISRLAQEVCLLGIPHRTIVQRGRAAEVISAVIEQDNSDLLVVGTSGRTGLKKMALGSVAEQVVRTAKCPVLTIGPLASIAPRVADLKTILFATDFGAASEQAFHHAASIAERFKAKLILLHTIPPIPEFEPNLPGYMPPATAVEAISQWEDRVRKESLTKLKTLVSSFSKPIEAEYAVSLDFSPQSILDFMALHKPQLLVMGANRPESARLAAHLPWTVLHEVLCGAHSPVLTIAA